MRIRILTILTAVFLMACSMLTGCANRNTSQESGAINENNKVIAYDFEPLIFYSFDDFVNSIAEANAANDIYNLSSLDYYYIPPESISNITLDAITIKDRYVCIYYYLNDLSSMEYSSVHEEEMARIANTVKLEWVRNADGGELLENTIEQLSLDEASPGIYYCDITYPTQPDVVLAKSLFWVRDGYMFNLDLPLGIYEDTSSRSQPFITFTDILKVQICD